MGRGGRDRRKLAKRGTDQKMKKLIKRRISQKKKRTPSAGWEGGFFFGEDCFFFAFDLDLFKKLFLILGEGILEFLG